MHSNRIKLENWNHTNETGSDDTGSHLLDTISNLMGYYLLTLVSLIGLVLNLGSVKALLDKSLRQKF